MCGVERLKWPYLIVDGLYYTAEIQDRSFLKFTCVVFHLELLSFPI